MIKQGQILHIKTTGEKLVCRSIPKDVLKDETKMYYYFNGIDYPINHEQIRIAIKFNRWEVLDNVE